MKKVFALAPITLAILIAGCGATSTAPTHHQNRPTPTAKAPSKTSSQATESAATVSQQFIEDTAALGAKSANLDQIMGGWMPTTPVSTIRAQMAPVAQAMTLYTQQLVALAKVSPQPLADDFTACALKETVVDYELNKFATETTYGQAEATAYQVMHAEVAASPEFKQAGIATGLLKG